MNILIEGGRLNPINKGEGTRNITLSYAKKLTEKGHKVIILTRKKDKDNTLHKNFEIYDGIKFYRWSNYFNLFFIFKKIANEEKIDIINIFAKGARPSFYIDFIKKIIKKPIVFNLLGYPFTKKYKNFKKTLSNFKKIDKVLISSKTIYNLFLRFGLKNLEYLPYGIDINKFFPEKRQASENKTIFLCLRNPEHNMLKAIEKLNKEINLTLILNDKNKVKNIKIIKEFDINFKLIGHLKNLPRLFRNSDIILELHKKEGYVGSASPPLIILEAMACGANVLATKKPEIEEVIIDGKNGFLIEKNKTDEIYNKIKEILKSKKDINKQARKSILVNYNLDEIIKDYLEINNQVINERL